VAKEELARRAARSKKLVEATGGITKADIDKAASEAHAKVFRPYIDKIRNLEASLGRLAEDSPKRKELSDKVANARRILTRGSTHAKNPSSIEATKRMLKDALGSSAPKMVPSTAAADADALVAARKAAAAANARDPLARLSEGQKAAVEKGKLSRVARELASKQIKGMGAFPEEATVASLSKWSGRARAVFDGEKGLHLPSLVTNVEGFMAELQASGAMKTEEGAKAAAQVLATAKARILRTLGTTSKLASGTDGKYGGAVVNRAKTAMGGVHVDPENTARTVQEVNKLLSRFSSTESGVTRSFSLSGINIKTPIADAVTGARASERLTTKLASDIDALKPLLPENHTIYSFTTKQGGVGVAIRDSSGKTKQLSELAKELPAGNMSRLKAGIAEIRRGAASSRSAVVAGEEAIGKISFGRAGKLGAGLKSAVIPTKGALGLDVGVSLFDHLFNEGKGMQSSVEDAQSLLSSEGRKALRERNAAAFDDADRMAPGWGRTKAKILAGLQAASPYLSYLSPTVLSELLISEPLSRIGDPTPGKSLAALRRDAKDSGQDLLRIQQALFEKMKKRKAVIDTLPDSDPRKKTWADQLRKTQARFEHRVSEDKKLEDRQLVEQVGANKAAELGVSPETISEMYPGDTSWRARVSDLAAGASRRAERDKANKRIEDLKKDPDVPATKKENPFSSPLVDKILSRSDKIASMAREVPDYANTPRADGFGVYRRAFGVGAGVPIGADDVRALAGIGMTREKARRIRREIWEDQARLQARTFDERSGLTALSTQLLNALPGITQAEMAQGDRRDAAALRAQARKDKLVQEKRAFLVAASKENLAPAARDAFISEAEKTDQELRTIEEGGL
jgi:hypothetical protein